MPDLEVPLTTASAHEGDTVALGSRVRLRDAEGEHEHTIVARVTANAPLSCVSVASPVGRALLGRRRGERVEVHTPGGVRLLTIVDVAATASPSSADSPPTCEG